MWWQWNNVVVGARQVAERTELPTTDSAAMRAGSPVQRWRSALGRYLPKIRYVPSGRVARDSRSSVAAETDFWLPHDIATTIARVLIAIDFALPSGSHRGERRVKRAKS